MTLFELKREYYWFDFVIYHVHSFLSFVSQRIYYICDMYSADSNSTLRLSLVLRTRFCIFYNTHRLNDKRTKVSLNAHVDM